MFGKPEWFRATARGKGLVPVTRQGWIYAIVWGGVLLLPAMLLMNFGRSPEALIWLVASGGTWFWDVRQMLRAKRPQVEKDVLYIGDDDDGVQTRQLNLHVRR